jgi:type I restriction enzyme M protein
VPSALPNHTLNNIPDVLFRWFHKSNEQANKRTEQSFFVPCAEIISNDYDLSINRYKEVVYEEVHYDPPKVILQRIKDLQASMDKGIADLEDML